MAGKIEPENGKTCPICGAPRDEKYRPFCSRRCADVDLNRWLSGRYAVPAVEADDTDLGTPSGTAAGDTETDRGHGN